jgi:hypothetical protein
MAWDDLEWPPLPDLPVPLPTIPPPAPPVGARAALLVVAANQQRERRLRGWMLFCAIWLGLLALGSAVAGFMPPPHPTAGDWQGIIFLAGGFILGLLAFAIMARAEHSTTEQRRLAAAYLDWQIAYEAWLAQARQAYCDDLTADQRVRFTSVLAQQQTAQQKERGEIR